jgi:Ca2+-transporting ATPase
LVLREARTRRVAARELVVGDRVLLAEGDRVPADLQLVEARNLALDESLLTGESMPVSKATAATAFSGSLVSSGKGSGLVTATGARSALGRIGESLAAIEAAPTPIQREMRTVVKRVAAIGLALAAALALGQGLRQGDFLQGLLAGITLAMAILPEELPFILTLFLGLGAWRLARQRVLARSMPAVELLGATTVLCVDKTGTLTANRMSVRRLWSAQATFDTVASADSPMPDDLHGLLEYAVLASHRRAFDPMETAIVEAGLQGLANTEHLHADWHLIEDYPLSPEMLAMSRVWQSPDQHGHLIAAKGAPEAIVDLCHLDATQAALIAAQVKAMAVDGLRVLGVAQARFESHQLPPIQHDFDFEFLGLLALEDPVRPEVPAAIAECLGAGIRVVMMTGDHSATALAIARQAGLAVDGPAISGPELAQLSDAELSARLPHTQVFCRVQPEQKLRLVQAFQARGDVVAMTGDGVNDAPALKAADIGVAMGARGTEVARESADLVLLNDDFASLVTAVRYGRRVFGNLRKAIVFVLAVHLPIVGLSVLPVLLGWPLLLMPVHIMFLQLVIDPACSIVFEAEALEPGAMRAPPRRADQRLFDGAVLTRGLWQGAGMFAILAAGYAGARLIVPTGPDHDGMARALTFSVMVLANLGLIHANRAWFGISGWRAHAASNRQFGAIAIATVAVLALVLEVPTLARLFSFVTPPPSLLLAAVGLALLCLVWFEAVKLVLARRR